MNSSQQMTSSKNRKIRSQIQKKPYSQTINGEKYTYSILPKKQKTFVLTHDRFVVVRGIEQISYSKLLPTASSLPFKSPVELPKPKATYKISQIEKATIEQEKLFIHFSDGEQWSFICPALGCAHQWRKVVQQAKHSYNDFIQNKFKPYEEPIVQAIATNFTSQNPFNTFYSPPKKFEEKPVDILSSKIVQNFMPESPPQPPLFLKPSQPQAPKLKINPQQPLHIQPAKADIDGLKDAILKTAPSQPPSAFMKHSNILSFENKQKIKSEIISYRRNWIQEIILNKESSELIFGFKTYAQKIFKVIIDEIYISPQDKIFPQNEMFADFANYFVDDLYVEVYFYSEQNLQKRHQKELSAIRQFKNYDYLLQATRNEGYLLVPLMVLFEYKGFTGMAKTRINNGISPFQNQFLYNHLDLQEFVQDSRITPEIFLDQARCKIVSYETKRVFMNQDVTKVYFLERLQDFLPYQSSDLTNEKFQLRPQLISDQSLKNQVFREKQKPLRSPQIQLLIQKKITLILKSIEQEEQYFINSKQLSQIVHSYGLNMTHLGQIYKLTKLAWFRRILQAEIAARCLKNFFRLDMQICIKNQTQRKDFDQRHTDKEKKAAICFLNIVFGNSSDTYQLWLKMNAFSKKYYEVAIWEERFQDINMNYLLQAIQSHLKITLSDEIHQRSYFKSMHSLYDSDFVKFQCDVTIYNLDFTQNFSKINSYLQSKTAQSFHWLCTMVNKQSSRGKRYMQLLRQHQIFQAICQYFLTFITPDEYPVVYSKMQEFTIPSRFIFQCELTQIKWFIKGGKIQNINKSIRFIQVNGRKWLGEVHPLFVKLNRTLAQFYLENQVYSNQALNYANQALKLQQQINRGDAPWLWKDYYLIGRIYFIQRNYERSIIYLGRAQQLAKSTSISDYDNFGELVLTLCKCLINLQRPHDSYNMARDLYNKIKNEWSEGGKSKLVGCVSIMKSLLQKNQQHEAYAKFIQYDFSNQLAVIIDNNSLLAECIKLIAIPFLKRTILQKAQTRIKFYKLMGQISQVNITAQICSQYFSARVKQGKFPHRFINAVKNFDGIFEMITINNILEKWVAYYRMSNQTLLVRIVGSEISKDFEFLADLTGILGILGDQFKKELEFMQN